MERSMWENILKSRGSLMVAKAVIFDVDGVLINSTDLHWIAYCEAIGKGVDKMGILLREGMTAERIIEEIAGLEGDELKKAVKRKLASFARLRGGIRPDRRAIGVVKELKNRGIKAAMATGTIRENVDAWFGEDEELFDAVVAAEDTPRAKPSPEPYLLAAKKLGVPAEGCVVVENAPLGVKGAKAAGMKCIAITSTLPAEYLKEADVVIDDIEDVLKWI